MHNLAHRSCAILNPAIDRAMNDLNLALEKNACFAELIILAVTYGNDNELPLLIADVMDVYNQFIEEKRATLEKLLQAEGKEDE
ncbi:MAG: hypothetical protein SOX56_07690 [[Pasteurella] mairii]|uniref:Uncharacterized protein n=1 Tax=[Pasteurella] mairii TaxID=757 RepID=A0A379B3D0_9PAST|nr:hypothetical protein [[Pasteurella] mairii]SUB32809.1 Uncharacterised protein [[Pasteurella] mairii]